MKKRISLLLAIALALLLTACGKEGLDPANPVTLTMWHVYGEQAESPMNRLVDEFNSTVGMEKGIVINVTLMSNNTQIGPKLLDAQANKPGSVSMPDLFFGHVSNAKMVGPDTLLDWQDQFSKDELSAYVPAFIQDGMIGDKLAVFPVSKSTHLLFVNGTQFERFCADTGMGYDDLATWEGFFDAAERYYEWSGGKCFCAFDYMLRCVELHAQGAGASVMTEDGWYDFGNEELRASWMMFAEPLAQGHISVSNLYSNTQVMTGEVCAGLGSSAAILYYNDSVTYPDNTTEPINLKVLPLPQEPGREPLVTQAGVGLIARKTTELKAEAAAVFARWLTEGKRNLGFVTETGYMPVNNGAFEAIDHFDFADEGYASLYAALKSTRETGVLTTEPSFTGYYNKVTALYDGLRGIQGSLEARANAGEDVASLAEESWQLFSSIQ